jgi:hypothetical protein
MAKWSRRARGGPPLDEGEDAGEQMGRRVIFSRDWLDPRRFGESTVPGGTPSRAAMWFIYAVMIAVVGLCALAFIFRALGK